MAINKNQHFVPRCYLRPFTVDSANLAINLFNIDRKKFIPNAPVKNQCSGDYFYGKDDQLESAIQAIESNYAKLLRKILSCDRYVLDEEEKHLLKIFWLFQFLRTEAASRRSLDVSKSFNDALNDREKENLRFDMAEAVQLAMLMFAQNMKSVDDLKVCLIKNNTNVPFVTSDDPAILTNRWHFQNLQKAGGSFGLNRSGALAILPISPDTLFVAYDGDMYSLPHKNGWIAIRKDADADSLNQHQYLNARANLFIRPPINFEAIRNSFEMVEDRRLPARHRVNYAALDSSDGTHSRYVVISREVARDYDDVIVHVESMHPVPKHWPGFISWRHGAVVYTNGTAEGYIRKSHAEQSEKQPFFIKQPAFPR